MLPVTCQVYLQDGLRQQPTGSGSPPEGRPAASHRQALLLSFGGRLRATAGFFHYDLPKSLSKTIIFKIRPPSSQESNEITTRPWVGGLRFFCSDDQVGRGPRFFLQRCGSVLVWLWSLGPVVFWYRGPPVWWSRGHPEMLSFKAFETFQDQQML